MAGPPVQSEGLDKALEKSPAKTDIVASYLGAIL